MDHSDFLSQLVKWEAALDSVESLDHGTEAIKPVVESFTEPDIDMIGVDELEAFLDEMEKHDLVCK